MEKEILELEAQLTRLKEAYRKQQKEQYENKLHRNFNFGDIVTDRNIVGMVAWTENKSIGLDHKMGYMGLEIVSGNRGFIAPVKRDDYTLVTDPYYTDIHSITLQLTGLEIEELKYCLGSYSNKTKDIVLGVLELVHNKS